jgi:AraC-like DNA-binding protein
MRLHIQTDPVQKAVPQVLQVEEDGRRYAFNLLHATLSQRFPGRNWCKFREHTHDVYHIVLYTHGADELLLNKVRHPVGPGMVALISPGELHDVAGRRDKVIVYSEVTFEFVDTEGEPLRLPFHELLSRFSGISLDPANIPLQFSEVHARQLADRFDAVLGWLEEMHPLSPMEMQRAVADMFAFLVRECFAPCQEAVTDPALARLVECRQFIERHYREPLRVEDLAAMAHLSKGYFLRAFKKAFDLPPIAYQQRLRIQAAMTLLRYTEYTCKAIAQRVGYEDEYLFSKTFKRATGMPPTRYREEQIAR